LAGRRPAEVWKVVLEGIKQQRVSLACAITVAVLLVGVFHAPPLPVLLGCVAALGVLIVLAYRKLPRT